MKIQKILGSTITVSFIFLVFPFVSLAAQPAIGTLDIANCDIIAGWAYDPDLSSNSIALHVYKDGPAGSGTFVVDMVTWGLRQDINNVFGITGNHGFTIYTPTSLKDGNAHSIYIHAIDATGDNNNVITGSPKTIHCSSPTPTTTPTPVPLSTCPTSITPQSLTFTDTSGIREVTASGVASTVTSVLFPTWSEVNGQDDLIWHRGVDQGNGVWKASINLVDHPGLGTIFIDVYVNPGTKYCSPRPRWTRTQAPTPTPTPTPTGSAITVTYPNGGENFKTNQQVRITWDRNWMPDQANSIVRISYNNDGLSQSISENVPDGGYTWTIPEEILNANNANRFKISIASNGFGGSSSAPLSDESDNYFSIT